MNLFSKYYRINGTAAVLVSIFALVSYYFLLQFILLRQLDDSLLTEKQRILDFISVNHRLPQATEEQHHRMGIDGAATSAKFNTVNLFDKDAQDFLLTRQLSFPVDFNGQKYISTVSKSQEPLGALLQTIMMVTLLFVSIWYIVFLIANHLLLKKISLSRGLRLKRIFGPGATPSLFRLRQGKSLKAPLSKESPHVLPTSGEEGYL